MMSTLKSFLRHPTGMIGLIVLLAVVLLAVTGPVAVS